MSPDNSVNDLPQSVANDDTDHGSTPTRKADTITIVSRYPSQSPRDDGGETGRTGDSWNSRPPPDHTIAHPSNAKDEGLTKVFDELITGPSLLSPWTFKDQMRGKGLSHAAERTLAMPHVRGLVKEFERSHATKEPTAAESFRFGAELNRWAITYSENPKFRAKNWERMEAFLRSKESHEDPTAMKEWHEDLKIELFGKPTEPDQLGSWTDDQGGVPPFFHLFDESSPSNPRD